jgi:hypothetical protein
MHPLLTTKSTSFATVCALVVFAGATIWSPQEAESSVCSGAAYEPRDVEVVKEPASQLECVTVTVRGEWSCGDSPSVTLRNDCTSDLVVDDDSLQCGPPEERRACEAISTGSVGSVELQGGQSPDTGVRRSRTYEGTLGGGDVSVTVRYDRVQTSSATNNPNGCGCGGLARDERTPVGLLLFAIPAAWIRRRGSWGRS